MKGRKSDQILKPRTLTTFILKSLIKATRYISNRVVYVWNPFEKQKL